jgi:hypothetical protein
MSTISAAPQAGYSFATWCEFYANYLEQACSIPKLEARLDWLDVGHDMHVLALTLMGKSLAPTSLPPSACASAEALLLLL